MEDKLVGKKVKPIPVDKPNIGVDLEDTFQEDILDAISSSTLDVSALESFSNVAQTREEMYSSIDIMAQDSKVSAILETYTDYVCQTNDNGRVVWVESSDDKVANYVDYLLTVLDIDKHSWPWVYSLIEYGDIYWQHFRESDFNDVLFNKKAKDMKLNESVKEPDVKDDIEEEKANELKENVILNINDKKDHLVHYIEAVANPGEMFELTKFGKTMGYIKATTQIQKNYDSSDILNFWITYKMRKNDVEVYDPLSFAHAYLKTSNSRNPEEVNIYLNEEDEAEGKVASSYKVKRGQSLLLNKFKTWRELTLLENSLMLNRITKSAVVRVVQYTVGNMPKDQVIQYGARLKDKIEQKAAVDTGNKMNEYTNPGPMENTIYVPVRDNNLGSVNFSTLGGDVDVKSLADIEYFENDFYGGFGIPKQYFGRTNDNTGFNGGTSLSIISSKFGTNVKSIQNAYLQGLTDVINQFLLDKGLLSYINNFTLKMQEPVTQEYKDRQDAQQTRVGVVQDLMQQLDGILTDEVIKAKVVKEFYSTTNVSPEVLQLIQDQIDLLEKSKEPTPPKDKNSDNDKPSHKKEPSFDIESSLPSFDLGDEEETTNNNDMGTSETSIEEPAENASSETLPSPSDLGIDMTSSENI